MKIVIIHHHGLVGGAGRSLLQTVSMLKDKYDISVMVPKDSGMEAFLRQNSVDVIPYGFQLGAIPYYSGGPGVFSRTYWRKVMQIGANRDARIKAIENCCADIFMINSSTEYFIAKEIKEHTKASVICFIRETLPCKKPASSPVFRKMRSTLEKYADGVFFISDWDRHMYNLKLMNSVTVRNSVPEDYFAPFEPDKSKSGNEYNLLYLGGNDPIKGESVVAEAMKLLPENVKLLYAGAPYDKMSDDIKSLGERVKCLGLLSDMKPAFTSCDAVLFPVTHAHQGRPIFEAGAFGKPVIASDFPQLYEDITDGVNGALFTPGDPAALADTVKAFLSGSYRGKTPEELGAENRIKSEKNHSAYSVKETLIDAVSAAFGPKRIKYLHIMTDSNYATVDGYTKLINNNFPNEEHTFIIRDSKDNPRHSLSGFKNIVWLKDAKTTELRQLFSYMEHADRIFWHSMGWYWTVQLKTLLKPSIMKKSTWVEWGADLFDWKRTDGNPVVRFGVNTIHRLWRSNVNSVVAIFPTDEKVYHDTFSKKVPVMHATYSVYHHSQIDEQKPAVMRNDGVTKILVGHSATPNCHHLEVLDALAHFSDENIMIYIPLSYGDTDYAEKVKEKAFSLFPKEKIVIQTENMPLWDYVHFLWDIDIGIFKVYRQIALGNICRLLYMTKKVFLPEGSLLYNYYAENDTEIYDTEKIASMSFEEFSAKPVSKEPSQCIKDRMTQEKVIDQWRNVFKATGKG